MFRFKRVVRQDNQKDKPKTTFAVAVALITSIVAHSLMKPYFTLSIRLPVMLLVYHIVANALYPFIRFHITKDDM